MADKNQSKVPKYIQRRVAERIERLRSLYEDAALQQAEQGALATRNTIDRNIEAAQIDAGRDFAKGYNTTAKRDNKIAAMQAKMEQKKRKANQPPDRETLEKQLVKMQNKMASRSGILSAPEGAPPEIIEYYKRINQTRSAAAKEDFNKINALRAKLGMKPLGYKSPPPPIDKAKFVGPQLPAKPDDYMKFAQNMGYVQPDSSFVAQMDSTYNTTKPSIEQAGSRVAPKATVKKPKKSFNQRSIERNRYKMKPRRQRN